MNTDREAERVAARTTDVRSGRHAFQNLPYLCSSVFICGFELFVPIGVHRRSSAVSLSCRPGSGCALVADEGGAGETGGGDHGLQVALDEAVRLAAEVAAAALPRCGAAGGGDQHA